MGTKGSAHAIARVIVHVNLIDPQTRKPPPPTPALATAQISVPARGPSPTPSPAPAQIVLTSSSPSSSIKVVLAMTFWRLATIKSSYLPRQASMSETLGIAFESCGTCGYQWVQLDSTPAFLIPVQHISHCKCLAFAAQDYESSIQQLHLILSGLL